MAKVGVGIKRHRREKHHYRLLQRIGRVYGHIECGVVDAALSALHPVDNASSVGRRRSIPAHGYSRILRKLD